MKVVQKQTIPAINGTVLSTAVKTGRTVPGQAAPSFTFPSLTSDSLFVGLMVVNFNAAVVTVTLEGSMDNTNWIASLLTATAVPALTSTVPGQQIGVHGSTTSVVGELLQNLWANYRFKVVGTNTGNVDCYLVGLSA